MRELVRSSAQVRKREIESDLNVVGPKTVESAPNRSDRSGPG